MSRKKGKAQNRKSNWHSKQDLEPESLAAVFQKFAPKATKLPSWRQAEENLDQLPKQEGMVMGLFPGGVLVRSQGHELICAIAGTFRVPAGSSALAVGDEVTVAVTGTGHLDAAADKDRVDGLIISRQVRRTLLARPQPRSAKHRDQYDPDQRFLKVIVANIEQLLIVTTTVQPRFRIALVERFGIIAQRGELQPILVINKIDLARPDDETLGALAGLGMQPLLVSAATAEGLEQLRARLVGRRTVLSGASGVGKSTLVNALIPGAAAATREIRMKDQRGRHTTAAAIVYDLPGEPASMLVDTPGVRELAVEMDATLLPWYFPEFEAFAGACRFNDCTHTHEPQCAVIHAVEEGHIPPQRYESYLRLVETLE